MSNSVEWTVDDEISLFGLICERKPAGKDKDQHMDWIVKRLNEKLKKVFLAADVWEKLLSYYDLE